MDLKEKSAEESVWIIHYINYDDGGYSGIEAVSKDEEAAFEKWRELIFYRKYEEDLPYGDVTRAEFDKIVTESWKCQVYDDGEWNKYTVRQYAIINGTVGDDYYKEAMNQTSQGLYLNDDGKWS